MSQIRRSDYLSMRLDFEPTSESIRLVIVAESPPASSKYFYNTNGKVSEPLFKALMKQLCIRAPNTKADGLREFQKRGWVLVDATYQPVNKLSSGEVKSTLNRDYPELCDDLKQLLSTRRHEVPLILIKANVCKLLEPELRKDGFNVANRGHIVYFPRHGHQSKFDLRFREIVSDLGLPTTDQTRNE